jgi:acyl dehydratase
MASKSQSHCFQQLHVDVARSATDDFNPFHDPHRWHCIQGNRYGGPIVLGFQLVALADHLIDRQRESEALGLSPTCRYSNYDVRFAQAVLPGEVFRADVRPTLRKSGTEGVSTRVILRKEEGSLILRGSRSDMPTPMLPLDLDDNEAHNIETCRDRCRVPGTDLFVKRKYLNTSNGKNFLLGSLIDPFFYFDELSDRVSFPPMFTASLISCALLERARADCYDFEREPQVYVSQRITVDRARQQALRSNDRIDLLVESEKPGVEPHATPGGVGDQQRYRCLGIVTRQGVLFRASVTLTSLQSLTAIPKR